MLLLFCIVLPQSEEAFAAKSKQKRKCIDKPLYIDRYLCDEPYPAAVIAKNACKTNTISTMIFWVNCEKMSLKIIDEEDETDWFYPAQSTVGYSLMRDICQFDCFAIED